MDGLAFLLQQATCSVYLISKGKAKFVTLKLIKNKYVEMKKCILNVKLTVYLDKLVLHVIYIS